MIRQGPSHPGWGTTLGAAAWLVALFACGSGSDPGSDLDRLRQHAPGIRTEVAGDRITRVYGKPVDFGASSAEAGATAFVSEYAGVFGAASDDLVLQTRGRDGAAARPLRFDPKAHKHVHALVRYRQRRGGIPVHAAELDLLLANRDGFPVTLATSNLRPLGNFEPTIPVMKIDAAASRAAAFAFGLRHPDPLTLFVPFTGLDDFETPEPVIWAGAATASEAPRMAFRYIGVRRNPQAGGADERWEFVAESGTGRILFVAPDVAQPAAPGRVLGAVPWEIRNRLLESEPDDYPTILAGLVVSSGHVAANAVIGRSLAIDLLSLDDDDGDLANGTPQLQDICDGLGAHGIACPDLTSVDPVRCLDDDTCEDGVWCNGAERCVAKECRAAEVVACGPGLACVESERSCRCSDAAACSDGDFCNGVETCRGGTCMAATASPCKPEQICLPGDCWDCMPVEFGGDPEACSDGDWCNGAEICTLGVCVAAESPRCPSGQSCDADLERCSCLVDAVCDDGDFCNGVELCSAAGVCVAGTPPFCDDGLICNGVEVCRDGACRPGQPIVCRAPEICNEVTGRCGCASDADCSDGRWCNGDEICDAEGACAPGIARECPAGRPPDS